MTGWTSIDFGPVSSGESGIAATGTTLATAYQLRRKVTIFSSVVAGGIAALPSAYASGTHLIVKNRDPSQSLLVVPALGDQIEAYGVNSGAGTFGGVKVAPGGDAEFVSFDPPMALSPRTWWL